MKTFVVIVILAILIAVISAIPQELQEDQSGAIESSINIPIMLSKARVYTKQLLQQADELLGQI